jgi:hypothetical protein
LNQREPERQRTVKRRCRAKGCKGKKSVTEVSGQEFFGQRWERVGADDTSPGGSIERDIPRGSLNRHAVYVDLAVFQDEKFNCDFARLRYWRVYEAGPCRVILFRRTERLQVDSLQKGDSPKTF